MTGGPPAASVPLARRRPRLFHVKRGRSVRRPLRPFHVKHSRSPRRLGLLALLALTLPLLAACSLTDSPDGWAAPTTSPQDADVVLLAAGDERIVAYDFATGTEKWRFPDQNDSFTGLDRTVDPGAFYSNPAFVAPGSENEEIVVGAYADGTVYAIRTDGSGARELFDADALLVAGIVIDGTIAYVATTDQHVYAINTEDPPQSRRLEERGLLWDFRGISKEVWGTPALADTAAHGKILLVPGMDGTLYALRTADGVLAWQLDTDAAIATNIVVDGSRAYFGGFDRGFRAVDLETGDVAWENQGNDWFWTTPLLREGVIYVADLSGTLWAWSADDFGAPVWAAPYNANDDVRAQAILNGDGTQLILVTRNGSVHAVDRRTGGKIWASSDVDLRIPGKVLADPLLRGESIFVNNDDGDIFEVQVGRNAFRRIFPAPNA